MSAYGANVSCSRIQKLRCRNLGEDRQQVIAAPSGTRFTELRSMRVDDFEEFALGRTFQERRNLLRPVVKFFIRRDRFDLLFESAGILHFLLEEQVGSPE